MSRFSVENLPSQGAERLRCGTLWYIRKVRLSKTFMTKRLITLFSVEFFFTYTASKVRWRTPLCFRIFGTSKTFMFSRESAIFRRFFGLPVLKNLMGNPVSLTQYFVIETFYAWERKIKFFCRIFFVLQHRKSSWWPLLSFRLFGISKTFCHIMIFRQIFWSHSTEKLREEPSNVSESFKCQVSKKFMQLNGMSRFSVEYFPSQSAEGFRCGTLRYIRKVRLSKKIHA